LGIAPLNTGKDSGIRILSVTHLINATRLNWNENWLHGAGSDSRLRAAKRPISKGRW